MVLVADIGNSNVVFGLHARQHWQHVWRFETGAATDSQAVLYFVRSMFFEYGLDPSGVVFSAVSSVVPGATDAVAEALDLLFPPSPLLVGPACYHKLELNIARPQEIGTDLVANALAAYRRFKANCIAVDFGTALTFTAVSADGVLQGVAIAPGLKTAMKALSGNTAKLPEIPLLAPATAIGKSTVHAMQSGIVLGYAGLIDSMLERFKAELGSPCFSIATGGLSAAVTPLAKNIDETDHNLTLEGIRLMAVQ